eukprot:SAG22_NODE_3636_length_1601_cov_6.085885_1_plen_433_part_10
MPRDFLAENRSAALDFARKRREKAEAAAVAREARKAAEAAELEKQEEYMQEVEAYHEQARARGVSYGGGGGSDSGQPAESAREPEPASSSWGDVPIGAAVKLRPWQSAAAGGGAGSDRRGQHHHQHARKEKPVKPAFGREWNAGFADAGPAWSMLPANTLEDDEPLDYSPPPPRRKKPPPPQKRKKVAEGRGGEGGSAASPGQHAAEVRQRKERQRNETQARHEAQLAQARKQQASERRLAAARQAAVGENRGVKPFAALRAQLQEDGPDAGVIGFRASGADGGAAGRRRRPLTEAAKVGGRGAAPGAGGLAMADPSQVSWADFQRMMATEVDSGNGGGGGGGGGSSAAFKEEDKAEELIQDHEFAAAEARFGGRGGRGGRGGGGRDEVLSDPEILEDGEAQKAELLADLPEYMLATPEGDQHTAVAAAAAAA